MAAKAQLQEKLQKAVENYNISQNELTKCVENLQKLDAQLNENNLVEQELKLLTSSDNVYKLIGPVLVKQDLEESKANVSKRIEYISGELKRFDARMKDLKQKQADASKELNTAQTEFQAKFGAVLTPVCLTALSVPFVLPAFRKIALPYIPATPTQLSNLSKSIEKASVNGKFLDLGSGDGTVMTALAKQAITCDGVELNSVLHWYAKFRSLQLRNPHIGHFYRNDMFNINLKPYDAIVIFGVPSLMPKLQQHLQLNCQPQVTVFACRFPFENTIPLFTLGENVDTVFTYRKPFVSNL